MVPICMVPNSVNWYQVYITKVLNIVYYFSKFSCSCTHYTFKQISRPMFNREIVHVLVRVCGFR